MPIQALSDQAMRNSTCANYVIYIATGYLVCVCCVCVVSVYVCTCVCVCVHQSQCGDSVNSTGFRAYGIACMDQCKCEFRTVTDAVTSFTLKCTSTKNLHISQVCLYVVSKYKCKHTHTHTLNGTITHKATPTADHYNNNSCNLSIITSPKCLMHVHIYTHWHVVCNSTPHRSHQHIQISITMCMLAYPWAR